MALVRIGSAKSIGPGKMAAANAGGNDILLVNLAGKYYAIGNKCTHMGCRLASGTITGENVQCPCHGSAFSLKSGKVVKGPAKKDGPSYKVKVSGDDLMVEV